jgi:hypothetical protein
MIRPGPPWIERNQCPGGIVIWIYTATDPPLLLHKTHANPGEDIIERAELDGDTVRRMIAADTAVCLVVYDGDTGERMKPQGLAGGR